MHYRSAKFLFSLILFCGLSFGGNAQSKLSEQINQLRQSAADIKEIDHQKAYRQLDKAIALATERALFETVFECWLEKAEVAEYNGLWNDNKAFLLEAESYFKSERPIKESNFIKLRKSWGIYYDKIGLYDQAVQAFNFVIRKIEEKDTLEVDDYFTLISTYLWIADLHEKNGRYQDALETLQFCKQNERKVSALLNEEPRFAYYNMQIARIYSLKGDQEKARQHYNEALVAFDQAAKDPERRKNIFYVLTSFYLDMSDFHRKNGQVDQAFTLLDKAEAIKKGHHPFKGSILFERGKNYAKIRNHARAIDLFERSKNIYQLESEGRKTIKIGACYMALADVYLQKEDYSMALQYYQDALIELSFDFEDRHLSKNPVIDNAILSQKQLLNLLGKKSIALDLFSHKHQNHEYQQWSWKTIQTAIDLIENILQNYTSSFDKQFIIEESYPIFEHAIKLGFEMGGAYSAKAFEYSERSKAIVLQEALLRSNAEKDAGLTSAQLEKIHILKAELLALDQKIFQARSSEEAQPWEEKRFHAKKSLQAKVKELESKNIKYKTLKYRNDPVTAEIIQKELLGDDQALISYFLGDQNLYTFIIDKKGEGVQILKQDWNPTLTFNAISINEDIYSSKKAYVNKAYSLYQKLLAPALSVTSAKRLILIPDGILGYIPFPALLSAPVAENNHNFKDFPYLVRTHQISQCFSASMLDLLRKNQVKAPEPRLLAYAPAFQKINSASLLAQNQDRNALDTLLYNIKEGEAVLSIFNGSLKKSTEAIKNDFLREAPHYNILHIASHAKVDDQNPDFSYIAFSNLGSANNEDFKLYVRELYNTQLPAELVVLSACETGTGKVFKGEGIVSIARAFMYAGAKSITMTLWNINDKQTKDLMEYYYHYLASGTAKDVALAKAQKDYLDSTIDQQRAHPKYWAAFTSIGDARPITQKKNPMYFFLAVAGLGIIIWRYQNKRKAARRLFQQEVS